MSMNTIIDKVLTALRQQHSQYHLQEVVGLCPDLTWNQVFLAIDYLTKVGQVSLRLDSGLTYTVQATGGPMAGE